MSTNHGKLGRAYWFLCGVCHSQYSVLFNGTTANVADGKAQLRHAGCIETAKEGWVCPKCVTTTPALAQKRLAGATRAVTAAEAEVEVHRTRLNETELPEMQDWYRRYVEQAERKVQAARAALARWRALDALETGKGDLSGWDHPHTDGA